MPRRPRLCSTNSTSCATCPRRSTKCAADKYNRLAGKDRSYIKGQRYTLLSNRENLSLKGQDALTKLLKANKRLNTAYVLKESFGQLWSYRTEDEARAFFERWKQSLRWKRLAPYQKFAQMIETHWFGIASYCRHYPKMPVCTHTNRRRPTQKKTPRS